MAKQITVIEEFWTDKIVAAGVASKIYFHFKALFDDGTAEWHYYGTPIPEGLTAIAHNYILIPPDLRDLPNESMILYSLALEIAQNRILAGSA